MHELFDPDQVFRIVDIAAVVTYERNAWGNNKGDMVTPKDVLALKQAEAK